MDAALLCDVWMWMICHKWKTNCNVLINKVISLSSKIRLMHSLVTSIFLYTCESRIITAELQRRIQAMEMRCYHKILHFSHKDHVTNKEVCAKVQQAIGPHEDLLTIVKRQTGVIWSCLPISRSGKTICVAPTTLAVKGLMMMMK